jgi:hypothetical protein
MKSRIFSLALACLGLVLSFSSASAQTATSTNKPAAKPAAKSAATVERKAPPYIILKVDDLRNAGGKVHPRWQKFVDFTAERKIKSAIGIIADSLEKDDPKYFQWIKDQRAKGLIEFWSHGYNHKEWEVDGKKVQEFKGPSYEDQKKNLLRCNELAKQKLGFTFPAFGAPFNAIDANTAKALSEDPDTTIWLYGDLKNPAGKIVMDRVGSVNIEAPTFVPSLQKFKAGYALNPTRDYFVIQGHPAQWTDERFAQFVELIDFLVQEKAIFTTPSEYVKLKGLKPDDSLKK